MLVSYSFKAQLLLQALVSGLACVFAIATAVVESLDSFECASIFVSLMTRPIISLFTILGRDQESNPKVEADR